MKPAIALSLCVAVLVGLAASAGMAVVYSGAYNVGATTQHWQPVYSLLETTMRYSVQLRARAIEPPHLDDLDRIQRGAAVYHSKCVQCHGAPGVAQGDIGKGMQPLPGPLVDVLQRWRPREIYWITRHGIKMSGMPSWQFRLDDAQLWDVTAFVQRLPELTPQAYAEETQTALLLASTPAARGTNSQGTPKVVSPDPANAVGNHATQSADIERGRQALYQYACSTCHTIPGITGSFPNVGPPLEGLASRRLIAGKLTNTPDNLVRWLRHPKQVKPLTAMPDMGVTEAHARDMAAFLATLY